MTTEEAILDAATQIRGKVLQNAIEIESLIDIYIAEHFTKDAIKISELITLILAPRITFENKAQIFSFLVDIYNPEFGEANSKYLSKLLHIIKERNAFAHYPVDFSKTSQDAFTNDAVVTFVKLKNSSDYKTPTGQKVKALAGQRRVKEKDINALIKHMKDWISALKALNGGFDRA